MAFFIVFICSVILGLCVTQGKSQKGFIGILLALLHLPFCAIFSLNKNISKEWYHAQYK